MSADQQNGDIAVPQIQNLQDLDTCEKTNFGAIVLHNLDAIFQYNGRDIQTQFAKEEQSLLVELRKTLCARIQERFEQYKDQRPVNRQVKHKLVSDIYYLGYCLVNDSPSKDLDKVFVVPSDKPVTPTEVSTDSNASVTAMVDILSEIADIKADVSYLKNVVKVLQDENVQATTCPSNPANGRQ